MIKSWAFWRQRRYLLTLMLFFGFFNVYSLRVNLSIAIVAMIHGTRSGFEPDFDWDSKQQGVVLSSFFYGYIFTIFAGGVAANKIGGRRLFGTGILCTAVLTLLSPLAAKCGYSVFVMVRIVEGFCEGVTYPALHAIWAKWAPPLERSRLNAIAFSGTYIGTVVMMPVSGIIAECFGWQYIFYFTGILGCFWYLLWVTVTAESPMVDTQITLEERQYIMESLNSTSQTSSTSKTSPPWRSIFTSGPVWAITVANFSENWGFYTLITQLPTYLKDTLDMKLEASGLVSGLPYLTMACMLIPSGWLADWVQVKGYLTTTQVRKYWNCGGFLAQAVFMSLAVVLVHPIYSILSLILAVGLGAFSLSGFAVNHLDLAPEYASILMGISNTFGTVPGILSPLISGFIVQDKSPGEWNIVFGIAASIYLIGCVTYWYLASGELQKWAKNNDTIEKKQQEIPTIAMT